MFVMLGAIIALFVPFIAFSCVLAYWFGPDLDPMVFVTVHTPWPISKGLDHPFCMSMFTCSNALSFVLASLVLGFVMFDTLHGLDLVWLCPTHMRPYSDVTIWEASLDARSLCAYPSPFFSTMCTICLPCLFEPPVGFICIFTHLLTCP